MKVVVGLGNPGKKYAGTRHNVGWQVIHRIVERFGGSLPKKGFEGEVIEVAISGEKVLLLTPWTFMNLSGRSVQQITSFYKLSPVDLLIVCDDLNLDLGRLRLRRSGSAGGQKGLDNIIQLLGTEDVPRLRLGIGRPPGTMDSAAFVLKPFRGEELDVVGVAVENAVDAVKLWVEKGIDAAMNVVNVRGESTSP